MRAVKSAYYGKADWPTLVATIGRVTGELHVPALARTSVIRLAAHMTDVLKDCMTVARHSSLRVGYHQLPVAGIHDEDHE